MVKLKEWGFENKKGMK